MKQQDYDALCRERQHQFVDWFFHKIEVDLAIRPSMFARAVNIHYDTLEHLKKERAVMNPR